MQNVDTISFINSCVFFSMRLSAIVFYFMKTLLLCFVSIYKRYKPYDNICL